MREQVTFITQSKYYSPAFNAAIFDGPIRIYFAQYQEAQALKLYFNLQERFSEVRLQARGIFKERGRNVFVMLYPTDETFDLSFGTFAGASATPPICSTQNGPTMICENFGHDVVVGVRGPMDDSAFNSLCGELDQIVRRFDIDDEGRSTETVASL